MAIRSSGRLRQIPTPKFPTCKIRIAGLPFRPSNNKALQFPRVACCPKMSRAIEATALFAVGCIAGGAVVYSTRRTTPASPPPQQTSTAPPPAFRRERDILVAEPVRQGLHFLTKVANGRISEIASLWESRTDS